MSLVLKFVWLLLKVIHLDVNSDIKFSTVFDVVLQTPSAGITATAPVNWQKFD